MPVVRFAPSLALGLLACGGPGPIALIEIDAVEGPIPLTVQLQAADLIEGDEVAWTFEDGSTSSEPAPARAFLASGDHEISLTVTDASGEAATDSVTVAALPGVCPESGQAEELGVVTTEALYEVSGVVESRANPGVLWVHNDAGHSPTLYALDTAGALLGTYSLEGAPSGDWEDLAVGVDPETGGSVLFVGDVGDNNQVRGEIRIFLVPEPVVTPGQAAVEEALQDWGVLELTYPGGALNSETLLWDPPTGDLYVITKDYEGPAGVYRKPAPHADGESFELELVIDLDFSVDPLAGGATTGGDVSLLGDRIVVRTYGKKAFVWLRDQAATMAETFAAAPCEIQLPIEPQGESVAFSVDGAGAWTISEGAEPSVFLTPLSDAAASDTGGR